jgi:transposase
MIVLGTDAHKRAHVAAAVNPQSGGVVGDACAAVSREGFGRLLKWARELDRDRVWAIEDCRHVSGSFERFLLARGEHVVRVPPRLMGQARRGGRERGKSDRIDAIAVARAAIREGLQALPAARPDGPELEIRLLVDHRERLVRQRTSLSNDLVWHLHDLWPELELPGRVFRNQQRLTQLARRLARAEQTARVQIARDELRRIVELTRAINRLETQLAPMVAATAPQLLTEAGCSVLTAAKLIGEIAGADRFRTDAQLARCAGVAPIPAASGRSDRHRLDRGGNRQLNAALHRLAVNKGRLCPDTAAYLARKQAQGKSRKEALRCLKRHLVRHVWQLLRTPPAHHPAPTVTLHCNMPKHALALT